MNPVQETAECRRELAGLMVWRLIGHGLDLQLQRPPPPAAGTRSRAYIGSCPPTRPVQRGPANSRPWRAIMGGVDTSHYSLVIAAAQAAGPCPPGEEAAW